MSKPVNSMKIVLRNSEDVANLIMEELKNEKREIAKLLVLDSKNVLLRIINIALGGGNFAAIEPKFILREPVQMGAGRIILVHNHPSGDPTPSDEDDRMTDRIYEAADIMGIRLLDHIIIGAGTFSSVFKNESKNKDPKDRIIKINFQGINKKDNKEQVVLYK